MRVVYEVGTYNSSRYSRPWIAMVTEWAVGQRPVLKFGGNVGSKIAEIEANPGDLLKCGQKDRRGNNSTNEFAIVLPDGELGFLNPARARDVALMGELGRVAVAAEIQQKREAYKAEEAAKKAASNVVPLHNTGTEG